MHFRPLHVRVPQWGDAMDGSVQVAPQSRGPSTLDWLMLAASFATVAWIVITN